MVKLPNFLIVGAAKAGTTSLYHYLEEHPEIFMSPLKEPKFITSNFLKFPFRGIGDDEVERKIIKDFNSYVTLFEDAKKEKAIGEASADNLYYFEQSPFFIKKFLGDVKIIIILRNPIDRAFSAYTHLVRDGREYLNFEEALQEEEKRKKENWEFIWFYKDVGFYYKQVKAYIENFSKVKIYLYEDLKDNQLELIKDIYKFLEVDDSFVPSNLRVKYNVSGVPKNKRLHYLLTKPNPIKKIIKPFIPQRIRRNLLNKIIQKNLLKPKMKLETKLYLKELYREDILKLQELIKRDLSHWLNERGEIV